MRIARAPRFGGWGLVASRDVAADERLVLLPATLQLTYDDPSSRGAAASSSPRTQSTPSASARPQTPAWLLALIAEVPPEMWAARLGLALLAERAAGAASGFAPYVRLLPATHSTPTFFTREGVRAMHYPPAVEQLNRRNRFLVEFADGPLRAAHERSGSGGAKLRCEVERRESHV